jgi:hypothetical protein
MKIAIILSGQLRTFNLCKWGIKSIKSQYDCDIFMGIDPNQSIQNENWNTKKVIEKNIIDDAINFVQPTQSYIFNESNFDKSFKSFDLNEHGKIPPINATSNEKLFTETDTHWEIQKPFDDSISVNLPVTKISNSQNNEILFRQYFLVKECYKMLINHINSTKTKYDTVIRLRLDMLIWSRRNPNEDFPFNKFIGDHPNYYQEHNIDLFKSIYKDMYFDFRKQDPNTVSTFKLAKIPNGTYICLSDEFWTHGMDLIEKMIKFYDNLADIINQVKKEHHLLHGGNIEHYFLRFLFNNNVKIRNIYKQNIYGQLIREFNKGN